MAATAAQVRQLRAMTAEPSEDTYTDEALALVIEAYPLLDPLGLAPFTWDYSTTPPSKLAQDTWIPTYDLHAAAAAVWQEKASLHAGSFDFAADGASFSRSQAFDMAMKQSRHHMARRTPQTLTQVMEPRRTGAEVYPVNASEPEG